MCNGLVGLELDSFEMINILQTHGMPRCYLALSKLDLASKEQIKVPQNKIKHRFEKETYPGNKVFVLPGIKNEMYSLNCVRKIGVTLQGVNRQPLSFRDSHGYINCLAIKDITD